MRAARERPTARVAYFAPLLGYGIAVAASVLAGVLTKWVSPFLGSTSFFELFHTAVVLSALYGGLGPGLLAATVSFSSWTTSSSLP